MCMHVCMCACVHVCMCACVVVGSLVECSAGWLPPSQKKTNTSSLWTVEDALRGACEEDRHPWVRLKLRLCELFFAKDYSVTHWTMCTMDFMRAIVWFGAEQSPPFMNHRLHQHSWQANLRRHRLSPLPQHHPPGYQEVRASISDSTVSPILTLVLTRLCTRACNLPRRHSFSQT